MVWKTEINPREEGRTYFSKLEQKARLGFRANSSTWLGLRHTVRTSRPCVFWAQSPRLPSFTKVEETYQGAESHADINQRMFSAQVLGLSFSVQQVSPEAVDSRYLTCFSEMSIKSVEEAVTSPGMTSAVWQQESKPVLCSLGSLIAQGL